MVPPPLFAANDLVSLNELDLQVSASELPPYALPSICALITSTQPLCRLIGRVPADVQRDLPTSTKGGQHDSLSAVLASVDATAKTSFASELHRRSCTWLARNIEQRFPTLRPGVQTHTTLAGGLFQAWEGAGTHELFLESPRHNASFGSCMTLAEVRANFSDSYPLASPLSPLDLPSTSPRPPLDLPRLAGLRRSTAVDAALSPALRLGRRPLRDDLQEQRLRGGRDTAAPALATHRLPRRPRAHEGGAMQIACRLHTDRTRSSSAAPLVSAKNLSPSPPVHSRPPPLPLAFTGDAQLRAHAPRGQRLVLLLRDGKGAAQPLARQAAAERQ